MNIKVFGGIEAGATLCSDKEGFEHVLVVAKATFDIAQSGACTLAEVQCPVKQADEHYGNPGSSSLRYECDFAPIKPLVDVIVNGSAHAFGGRPVSQVMVGLTLGSIRKVIRVMGDRVWQRSLLGYKPSEPRQFVSMPLVYERAFGGSDVEDANPRKHVHEPRNLVGVGYFADARSGVLGTPVANLEHPEHPIANCTQRSVPIGFGCIARHWQPRAPLAGTYDRRWREERFPGLPSDFDDLYHQAAPPDQRCAVLRGGEAVVLANMTPQGRLAFAVPTLPVFIDTVCRAGYGSLLPRLDTLIVEPDVPRCILVWRASMKLTCKLTDLLEVWIGTRSPGRQRAIDTGKRYLSSRDIAAWN